MQPDLTVKLVNGVDLIVPDDLRRITPYVLLEQGDWFEDEIRFVRAWAKPGLRALDVGASYGVYTTTFAQCAGPGGRVWAVEPGADVAAYLTQSLAANGFGHVALLPYAFSRADGMGTLAEANHTERRQLTSASPPDGLAVTVRTLDRASVDHGIDRVDFVKIDAEGAEADVLEGGAGFFARESPLLMLEFKNDTELNEDIFAPLEAQGYQCYRLVPGLNILVPFYEAEEVDVFQLNIFAAKPARAAALNAEGRLATGAPPAGKQAAPAASEVLARLCALPYARAEATRWAGWFERARALPQMRPYAEALGWHALAHDAAAGPDARVQALEHAYTRLAEAVAGTGTPAALSSFVRVAAESGRRFDAVQAAKRLLDYAKRPTEDLFEQPFLAPHSYQEEVAPAGEDENWLLWSTLEFLESARAYSSFYLKTLIHQDLGLPLDPRFASPVMARRESLMARRHLSTPGR
jgi:FkbM family methyltransferase